jgi:hypothetical protein
MFLYVCDDSLAPSASMPVPLMQLSVVKVKYAYTFSIFEPFHLVVADSSPFTKVPSRKILLYFDAFCFLCTVRRHENPLTFV